MEKIELFYGTDLKWTEHFATSFKGTIKENSIITSDDSIVSGTINFLDTGNGTNALYLDVEYNKDVCIVQKNLDDSFIGLYYSLNENAIKIAIDNDSKPLGNWQYNLAIIDSLLSPEHTMNKGYRSYALFIFIEKKVIKEYMLKEKKFSHSIRKFLNPKQKAFIKFDRISDNSLHVLKNLKKQDCDKTIFNINLQAVVNILLANYIQKVKVEETIIQSVFEDDLLSILKAQKFLIDNIEKPFPSIEVMAKNSNMSESKFKSLFKKISGTTPNHFYITNKLIKAKEMLEDGQLSISEVSDQLNFTNGSYFSLKFKEYFGISPKKFVKNK